MAEYFVASKEIQAQAWDLIGKQHPDLAGALNKGELAIVFRDKAAKSGGRAILGNAKKATPLTNALAGEEYVFIIELPQDEWEKLDSKQREACLDYWLCACRAEVNKKGDTKFSVVKPDYAVYRENIERYGMWFPKGDGEEDDGTDVTEMFSEKDGVNDLDA